MKTYTEQEVFNISYNHIKQQGEASVNEGGACVYSGPNGLSCAAAPFPVQPIADGVEGDED